MKITPVQKSSCLELLIYFVQYFHDNHDLFTDLKMSVLILLRLILCLFLSLNFMYILHIFTLDIVVSTYILRFLV